MYNLEKLAIFDTHGTGRRQKNVLLRNLKRWETDWPHQQPNVNQGILGVN